MRAIEGPLGPRRPDKEEKFTHVALRSMRLIKEPKSQEQKSTTLAASSPVSTMRPDKASHGRMLAAGIPPQHAKGGNRTRLINPSPG